MKLYSANSLEELARLFDSRADVATARSSKEVLNKRDRAYYAAAARVWIEAAAILRDTELTS